MNANLAIGILSKFIKDGRFDEKKREKGHPLKDGSREKKPLHEKNNAIFAWGVINLVNWARPFVNCLKFRDKYFTPGSLLG